MASTAMIGAAIKAGNSKTGKKLIGFVLGFIAFLLLAVMGAVTSLLSIFTHNKIESDFDAKQTSVYVAIRSFYDDYVIDVKDRMVRIAQQLEEDHTETREIERYNPETKEIETEEEEYCAATISQKYEHIGTAYVLAYLSIKHQDENMFDRSGEVRIDEAEVTEFWDTIAAIKVDEEWKEGSWPKFYIHNPLMTPEKIAEKVFASDILRKQYLESLYLIMQYIGVESFWEGTYGEDIGERMNMPLYLQYDPTWGKKPYGGGTISANGCGPTCIAMVFSYIRNESIYPDDIVDYTGNRYYQPGAGSSWQIFSACASQWGIRCTYLGKSQNAIIEALSNGKPVIISVGPGTFTKRGHFIVLTGVDGEGRVTVNDPNDNDKKDHASKQFYIGDIMDQTKGGWSFER